MKYSMTIMTLFLLFACKKEMPKSFDSKENTNYKTQEGETASSDDNIIKCSYCKANLPIGGGTGYDNIVTIPSSHENLIKAYDDYGVLKDPVLLGVELENVITSASDNDVIYIEGQCVIEVMTGIVIEKAITIASDRGYNGTSLGALIILNSSAGNSELFNIRSNNVRITGLRLKGFGKGSRGIAAEPYPNQNMTGIEIDNNEIYNWIIGVRVSEVNYSMENYELVENAFLIHHNYIYNNHFVDTHGYGVLVWKAYPSIYANIFNNNRHDIAGKGSKKSGYELFCNIFNHNNSTYNQSNVDMHGDGGNVKDYAGGFMHIHHNEFREINGQANIFPVGKPQVLCLIDNNVFRTSQIYRKANNSSAISQQYYNTTNREDVYGNIVAVNNVYNGKYGGWYVREDWDKNRTDNVIRIPSSNDHLHSNNEPDLDNNGWIKVDNQDLDYQFGDFDGDGATDIIMASESKWQWLPLNSGYTTHWNFLASSTYKFGTMKFLPGNVNYTYIPRLILGNFDADNYTDIFTATGSSWDYSSGSNPGWVSWGNSTYTMNQLLFGKFQNSNYNDEIMDVFHAVNSEFKISYDGSSWINYSQPSNISQYNMKTGDFNGNGTTDIFYTDQVNWYYKENAVSSQWVTLNSSGLAPYLLEIGDFNSDGKSDVFGLFNYTWRISVNGVTSWTDLDVVNFPLTNFEYGNLK